MSLISEEEARDIIKRYNYHSSEMERLEHDITQEADIAYAEHEAICDTIVYMLRTLKIDHCIADGKMKWVIKDTEDHSSEFDPNWTNHVWMVV